MEIAYPAAIFAAVIAFTLIVARIVRRRTKRQTIPEQQRKTQHPINAAGIGSEPLVHAHAVEQAHEELRTTTHAPLAEPDSRSEDHELVAGDQDTGPIVSPHIQHASGHTQFNPEGAAIVVESPATEDEAAIAEESDNGSEVSEREQKATRQPKQISPEKRGGRTRTTGQERGELQPSKAKPRAPKPEVVCWKREREWILALEIPEEVNAVSVVQGHLPMSKETAENDHWRLASLAEEVTISTSQGSDLTVGICTDSYLLFKLSGLNQDSGRRVRRSTSGAYLVVAPAEWTRDEALSGPPPAMPEYVSLEGYRAHFFDVEQSTTAIGFQDAAGRAVVVASCVPRFRLFGRQLQDAAENLGPLFVGLPPRMGITNGRWDDVGTIVVGIEGGGSDRWRTSVTPDSSLSEQTLPLKAMGRKVGWYFVRLYDLQDELVDSYDFRFAAGLQKIISYQGSPVPPSAGHVPVVVELQHEKDWQLRSHSTARHQISVERSHGQSKLVVPALQACDLSHWLFGPVSGPAIQLTILVERIWWAICPMTAPPIAWQDCCLSLSRSDFAPTSNQALWLRFPNSRWAHSVFVGFQAGRGREYVLKVSENAIAIPLRDFSDCQELASPSEGHDLKVWLDFDGNSYEAVIGTLPAEFLESPLHLGKCPASRLASALTALHRLSRGSLRQLAKEVRRNYRKRGHLTADHNLHFQEEALCVIALFFELEAPSAAPKRLNRYRRKTRLASKQFPETMRQVWRRYKELTCSSPMRERK